MHILKRKNTYYYKLKIPKDLQNLIKLPDIRFSLHTKSKKDALMLASTFTNKYYTLFLQLRSGIYEEELISLINNGLYLNINHLPLKKVNYNLPKTKTIKELSESYINNKVISNSWSEKTLKAFTFVFHIFSKVVDVNKDIKLVTRENLQEYRNVLFRLPLLKSNEYDLPLEEILKLRTKLISISTAQKYLGYICSFFKWCNLEGYLEKHIAEGLEIKEDKFKKEARVHYSIEDLNKLFNESPIYTVDVKETLKNNPERFYIPLIAMYQGMRINEIAQLYVEDIKLVDEVYCIDINKNTEDKKLKNVSSIRVIPIHKKLIELGLIDYWKSQLKKNEKRLWNNLSLGLEGYGTNFRKWYGSYNRKYVTQDTQKTFHSFRHLFAHTFRQLSLTDDIDHFSIKYLLGHSSSKDITIDTYTHGYNMKSLSIVLNKLEYEGIFGGY
ncbi:site-specific integrase [Aliarcobacter butzleri]|uniref:site-specific integrase n=1 Tax=Aliarcobacter butzleri TaxID=28197 RepID=UPI0021B21799|nr:site-specific integrase [Aliarcobacter butzleri]MCT7583276.1 site-specific integrase [Aliarcobacter butzleri]